MLVEKKFLVNKPRFEKSDGSFVDVTSFHQIQRKKDVARVLHGCFNSSFISTYIPFPRKRDWKWS